MKRFDDFEIEKADSADLTEIIQLLSVCDLPYNDVSVREMFFIKAVYKKQIVGIVALEIFSDQALFRSFAVKVDFRNVGIGNKLYTRIMLEANDRKINKLYLLTTSADKYFATRNWQTMNRQNVPLELLESKEFSTLCPSTAKCMCFEN